ncbi:hypothetical protein B0H14DRAFT_3149823 [Mycena olivaceomarginata]|nr:hypothetical protein B0H14DRAFT_3149823 [Mycena olivaceomarginata]
MSSHFPEADKHFLETIGEEMKELSALIANVLRSGPEAETYKPSWIAERKVGGHSLSSVCHREYPHIPKRPKELIEAILSEVPDAESLKSPRKMSKTSTFLTESPYIGEYIRRFAIQLAQKQSLPLEAIALILTKLQKVQHLTIAGSLPSKFAATPLPALTSLRSIEIGTSFFSADRHWVDITSLFLASANSAPLEDVIVSYRLYHAPRIAPTYEGLLLDLEQSLLSHPAAPRIRWRLGYEQLDFGELAGLIKEKMPCLHQAGRVLFS